MLRTSPGWLARASRRRRVRVSRRVVVPLREISPVVGSTRQSPI